MPMRTADVADCFRVVEMRPRKSSEIPDSLMRVWEAWRPERNRWVVLASSILHCY